MMRVLFVRSPRGAITGSSVYQDTLLEELSSDMKISLYRHVDDLGMEWDWIHVLDGKHMPGELSKSNRHRIILDLHDHYWTHFQPFPAPDFPVRWVLQKQRARRMKILLAGAHTVFVHSNAVKSAVQHPRLVNIGMGIRIPADRRGTPVREDRILIVGRDLFRKGITTLLAALRRIHDELPAIELCVVGREYPHALLAARVLALGLRVRFLGECSPEGVAGLYATSRAVILASWTEALGISVLEAMAHRVPVIVSTAGGLKEIVQHERTGQLFPPGDDRLLADALRRVWDDPGAVDKWAEQAQKLVRERFSIADMKNRVMELYRSDPAAGGGEIPPGVSF